MNAERCGNCRFYDQSNETTRELQGDRPLHEDDYEAPCRRYPPRRLDAEYSGRMVGAELLAPAYGWPTVQTVAWCGEWKQGSIATPRMEDSPLVGTDIRTLNLSVRTRNVLLGGGIDTVEQLAAVLNLRRIPNCGPKSVAEIEQALAERTSAK